MAITYVGSSTWVDSATNGGNVSVTVSSLVAGDYVVVTVGIGSSLTPTITVTSSSTSATYTQLGSQDFSSQHMAVFGKLLTAADTTVQSFGTGRSSDSTTMLVMPFRGVDPVTPIDATTTVANGLSTEPDSPNITVATSNAVIISAVNSNVNDLAVTAPSSFLNAMSINANDNYDTTCGMAWITNDSTSAFNPTAWTGFTSGSWGAATIALRNFVPTLTYQDYSPQFPPYFRTTEIVGY